MITKETCIKIWNCHNEIDKSKKIISEMAEKLKEDKDKQPPCLENAFGERRGLQLGVPSGDNGHYLYNISLDLSIKVIEEHIQANEKRLEELMAIAKIEINE